MALPSASCAPFWAACARQAFIWRMVMLGSTIIEAPHTHSVTQSSAGAHSGSTFSAGGSTSSSAAPWRFSGAPTGSMPGRGFSPLSSGGAGGSPIVASRKAEMAEASDTGVPACDAPSVPSDSAADTPAPCADSVVLELAAAAACPVEAVSAKAGAA